jgi:hypothetical protein
VYLHSRLLSGRFSEALATGTGAHKKLKWSRTKGATTMYGVPHRERAEVSSNSPITRSALENAVTNHQHIHPGA